ncbi:MAG: OmpA/MotB family protein [Planctomycetota bacterium]|jgi:chemotaxis protein MotB
MQGVAKVLSVVVLGLVTVSAQGCVGLHTFKEEQQKREALERAYKDADVIVGNYKQEITRRDSKIEELLAQLGSVNGQVDNANSQLLAANQRVQQANQRIQAANQAITSERTKLQGQYEQMLKELRAEGGGAFVINEATGGVVLENDIFFSPGKADLRTDTNEALDGLISKLRVEKFRSAEIEIAGHTDTDPITRSGWADNYQLSSERARAVLNYFVENGVTEERVFFSGYGATRPRGSDKSANRRVEVILHEGR